MVDFLANFAVSSGASDTDLHAGTGMKPRERRETGQNDLFKARFGQIIDMGLRGCGWRSGL